MLCLKFRQKDTGFEIDYSITKHGLLFVQTFIAYLTFEKCKINKFE